MNRKLEKLYSQYATNLNFYDPKYQDQFACPICLGLFDRSSLSNDYLSIEHFPPYKLKTERFVTITCKACNNNTGSHLDNDLIQSIRIEDSLSGKGKLPLKSVLKIGEGKFEANVFLSENSNNIHIVGIPGTSNPKSLQTAIENFTTGNMEFTIEGKYGYKETKQKVAALKYAYLLMFTYLGYRYILRNELEIVRKQIIEPETTTDVLSGIFWNNEVDTTTKATFLIEPSELRCFVVILNLSTDNPRKLFVVLPGLEKTETPIYQRWKEWSSRKFQFSLEKMNYIPSFLTDPKYNVFP